MSKSDVGDDDKIFPNGNFARSDIIVATYEALDWIFRSGQWKNIGGEIGTFVIDEVQLLADDERGATVDGLLSRIRAIYSKCQIICLSATIGNAENLASQLNLQLVDYMHRPIPLERHLLISSNDEERVDLIQNLVKNETKVISSSNHRGQSLIFTNTRRRVQELSSLLKSTGIRSAYYHAGMTYFSRKKVEQLFVRGELEAVTTTAALGAGADFPVSQVIFERPGMGARWISTAEYYQMSGRAGRFGYHDIGKSILIATPGAKIYSAQAKTEEQVAFELLTGDVEEVEGDMDFEKEAEQVLSYISSSYPLQESEIKKYYELLFYRTNQLGVVLKFLSTKGLIILKKNQWYITPLGRAICESFLEPTFGYDIATKTQKKSVREIAIEIAPLEAIYLSSKIHARIEQALKYPVSRKFLSDSSLEIITGSSQVKSKLSSQLIDRIKDWNRHFFDCSCKANPYCKHPQSKISDVVLDLRLEGLNPSQIGYELSNRYDLFMYPGDLLNWLDEIIHALHSTARLAKAMKEVDVIKSSRALAMSIENPKQSIKVKKKSKKKPTSRKKPVPRHLRRKSRK
jgi:helicase